MKKKVIVIFSIIIVLVMLGISFYYRDEIKKVTHNVYPIHSKELNDDKEEKLIEDLNENSEETEIKETESNEEAKKEESISQKDNQKESKQSNSKKKPETNNGNKVTRQTEAKEENKSKETNNNQDSGVIDSNGNAIKEEKVVVVKKEPWESAGVTEYEWYNNPVYSWMRVDYPVSSCGSVSKCESLCMSDAEELSYTENVSCIQVHTYSGNYLGEMLKRD